MIFSLSAVELSKAEARALLAHACTDETRPHVNAVYFDGRDMVAMATDAHRGVAAKGTGEPGQWHTLIPREALKNAVVAKATTLRVSATGMVGSIVALDKKGDPISTVAYEWPSRVERVGRGEETRRVYGEFPPLKTVMPRGQPTGVVAGVNADYLADIALVQTAAREASGNVGAIVLPPSGALDPLKFIVGAWVVTIMPMRIGEEAAAMRAVREAEDAIGPTRDQRPEMAPVKAPTGPALPEGFQGFDAPSFLPGYAPDDAAPGSGERRKAA